MAGGDGGLNLIGVRGKVSGLSGSCSPPPFLQLKISLRVFYPTL